MERPTVQKRSQSRRKEGITQITVSGYKSISQEQSLEIRPLTILAGANSSGKSSIMQPLLLLKQTLGASYDPGALLLDGPNVRFTSADQLLSRFTKGERIHAFHVGIRVGIDTTLTTWFSKQASKGFEIQEMTAVKGEEKNILRLGMTHEEIMTNISSGIRDFYEAFSKGAKAKPEWRVVRDRCFLALEISVKGSRGGSNLASMVVDALGELIHLPGLRGNPERTYPVTAVGPTFPGTFEKYVASVIAQWQIELNNDKLQKLGTDLKRLGLTWKVAAQPINDTQVELQVGRLTHAARGGAHDLVSIADVGFGVSQTLPVLVALHVVPVRFI